MALEIRQAQGWGLNREMQELMNSPWYDPAATGSIDSKEFYAAHSSEALALCFDMVETKSASYLGSFTPEQQNTPHQGRKPKKLFRFAVKDAKGNALSLISPGMKQLKVEIGAPLTVVIGRQNGVDRQTIVHASARQNGQEWDCLEQGLGVTISEKTAEKSTKFLILTSGEETRINGAVEGTFQIGDGAQLFFARNPKNSRIQVMHAEHCDLPAKDAKRIKGPLRRHEKGFGFVEDAFVTPQLIDSVHQSVEEVDALAIRARNPSKGVYGWRIIEMNAL